MSFSSFLAYTLFLVGLVIPHLARNFIALFAILYFVVAILRFVLLPFCGFCHSVALVRSSVVSWLAVCPFARMIALITVVAALVVWFAFILLGFVCRHSARGSRSSAACCLPPAGGVPCSIVLLLLFFALSKQLKSDFGKQVGWLGCRFCLTVFQQTQWLLALAVHFDDSLGTLDADGFEVGSKVLVRRVGDKTCQDIHLELMEITVGSLQYGILRRQLSFC